MPGKYTTQGEALEKRLEEINKFMVAIVLVLFLGFITLLMTSYEMVTSSNGEKAATYGDLRNQVHDQNSKIDALMTELQRQKGITPADTD